VECYLPNVAELAIDPTKAPTLVMFVRHGEKPSDHGAPHGINHHGEHDNHSLSVRGWMRAGALAGLLAHVPLGTHPRIAPPKRVLATKPSMDAKSRREIDTASPIARRLDLNVDDNHGHGEEDALLSDILNDPRPTLVVWHHGKLARLVRCFPLSNATDVPMEWPDDRFDLIWSLTREPHSLEYSFASINQQLLDGDEVTTP